MRGQAADQDARQDSSIQRKFQKVGISVGYFGGYIDEMKKAELQIISEVPVLIRQGRLDEALKTNEEVATRYDGLVASTEANTVVNHINRKIILDNAAFIESKKLGS